MATDPKKPKVKSTKTVPAGLKKVGSNIMQKAKSFMQDKATGPNKITPANKPKAGGLKMGSAAPKTGGGTTPSKDNAKTKTFARNAGVKTMKSLGSNNATVATKGGTTSLATYYQGKSSTGQNVTVPNKVFAGKTPAQTDSIAMKDYNVPKGGFKKVTTSSYNATPKASLTAKTLKGTKVTAKKN